MKKAIIILTLVFYTFSACSSGSEFGYRPAFSLAHQFTSEGEDIETSTKDFPSKKSTNSDFDNDGADSHIAYILLGVAIAGACAAAIALPLVLKK